jgi:hypothetical protein
VQRVANRFAAFGTPFAGELQNSGVNTSAPIAALYFLKQGIEHRINPLAPEVALPKLLRNILFFSADLALTAQLFETACDFLGAVPACELVFKADNAVWELMA